jgi:ATP-dependent exoDNAse (exonuclease V) beta subunit
VLSAGGADGSAVSWRAASGATHRLRHCEPANVGSVIPESRSPKPESRNVDFQPLVDLSPRRESIADAVEPRRGGARVEGPASDRLIGTLVHRLVQRLGLVVDATPERVYDIASRLVRPEEVDDGDDFNAVIDAAVRAYEALGSHPNVRELYLSGPALHEVPFTTRVDGRVLRGTVDCLIRTATGQMTILEFKTGRQRPEHAAQVELYRRAIQELFPDCAVDTRLVYAGGAGGA